LQHIPILRAEVIGIDQNFGTGTVCKRPFHLILRPISIVLRHLRDTAGKCRDLAVILHHRLTDQRRVEQNCPHCQSHRTAGAERLLCRNLPK